MIQKTEQQIMQFWKGDIANPVVSISCATYNHEKYINEALDGFLMQETDFPFEIVIGEDCSTDKTIKIIQQYKEEYPNIINLIAWPKNVGALKNWMTVLDACKGKYIANCEGDDYWISPFKLQKQVEVFESNSDCILCGTRVYVRRSESSTPYKIEPSVKPEKLLSISADDLFFDKVPILMVSRMFPKNIIKKYIECVQYDPANRDFLLKLFIVSQAGKTPGAILCVDDVMGCYRENIGGVWAFNDDMYKKRSDLRVLEFAIQHFEFPYHYRYLYKCLILLCESLGVTQTSIQSVNKHLKTRKTVLWKTTNQITKFLITEFKNLKY